MSTDLSLDILSGFQGLAQDFLETLCLQNQGEIIDISSLQGHYPWPARVLLSTLDNNYHIINYIFSQTEEQVAEKQPLIQAHIP